MVNLRTPLTPAEIVAIVFENFLRSKAVKPCISESSPKIEQLQSLVWNRLTGKSPIVDAALAKAKLGEPQSVSEVSVLFEAELSDQEFAQQVQEIAQQVKANNKFADIQPMPENLWGNAWRFIEIAAEDLEHQLLISPIPYRKVSPSALPSQQDIPLREFIPGIVIEAGKQSTQLALWIKKHQPISFEVLKRDRGGLVLNTLNGRWLMPTYQDKAVQEALKNFEALKPKSSGIHFLLVRQDSSGQIPSGLWILK